MLAPPCARRKEGSLEVSQEQKNSNEKVWAGPRPARTRRKEESPKASKELQLAQGDRWTKTQDGVSKELQLAQGAAARAGAKQDDGRAPDDRRTKTQDDGRAPDDRRTTAPDDRRATAPVDRRTNVLAPDDRGAKVLAPPALPPGSKASCSRERKQNVSQQLFSEPRKRLFSERALVQANSRSATTTVQRNHRPTAGAQARPSWMLESRDLLQPSTVVPGATSSSSSQLAGTGEVLQLVQYLPTTTPATSSAPARMVPAARTKGGEFVLKGKGGKGAPPPMDPRLAKQFVKGKGGPPAPRPNEQQQFVKGNSTAAQQQFSKGGDDRHAQFVKGSSGPTNNGDGRHTSHPNSSSFLVEGSANEELFGCETKTKSSSSGSTETVHTTVVSRASETLVQPDVSRASETLLESEKKSPVAAKFFPLPKKIASSSKNPAKKFSSKKAVVQDAPSAFVEAASSPAEDPSSVRSADAPADQRASDPPEAPAKTTAAAKKSPPADAVEAPPKKRGRPKGAPTKKYWDPIQAKYLAVAEYVALYGPYKQPKKGEKVADLLPKKVADLLVNKSKSSPSDGGGAAAGAGSAAPPVEKGQLQAHR